MKYDKLYTILLITSILLSISFLFLSNDIYADSNIAENTLEIIIEKFNTNSMVLHIKANILTSNKEISFYIAYEITGPPSQGVLYITSLPVLKYERGILIDTMMTVPLTWNGWDFPLDNLSGIFYLGANSSLTWERTSCLLQMPFNYYKGIVALKVINENEKGYYHKNIMIGKMLFQDCNNWVKIKIKISSSLGYLFSSFLIMYALPVIIIILETGAVAVYFKEKSKTSEFKKNLIDNFLLPILVAALISLPMYHLSIVSIFEYATLVYFNALLMPFAYLFTIAWMIILLLIQKKRK